MLARASFVESGEYNIYDKCEMMAAMLGSSCQP